MLPNSKTILKLLFICCAAFAPAAYGAEFNYVDPEAISPEFIAAPPAMQSAEQQQEAKEIIKMQAAASKDEIASAQNENHLTVDAMNISLPPKTRTLLESVKTDCYAAVDNAKDYWHYTRPYLTDPHIKPLIDAAPSNYSYPSGHTTCSRLMAEVLGQLAPDHRTIFRTRAAEIAHHRVLVGVHWPHDVIGGEQFALLFFGALQMSDDYQKDLAEAAEEWVK